MKGKDLKEANTVLKKARGALTCVLSRIVDDAGGGAPSEAHKQELEELQDRLEVTVGQLAVQLSQSESLQARCDRYDKK